MRFGRNHRLTKAHFEAAGAEWLDHLANRRRLSPHSVECYASDLRSAARLLPEAFRADEIPRLVGPRLGREVSASVRYKTWVALTQFFRWWESRGGPANPLAEMQAVPRSEARRRGATRAEISEMAAQLARPEVSDRDRAMVLLMTWNGLRVGDISALLVEDLDLPGRRIRLRQGKGGRDEWLTLGEPSAAALEAHLRRQARTGYVFTSSRRRADQGSGRRSGDRGLTGEAIRLAFKRVVGPDLKHLCPHQGRHTFASQLFETGANPNRVRRMMRHRSLVVTQTYLDEDPEGDREALAKLPVAGAGPPAPAAAPADAWSDLVRGMLPYLDDDIELATPAGLIAGWGPFRGWLEDYLEEHPDQRNAPRPHPFIYHPPALRAGEPVEVRGHTLGMMLELANMAQPGLDELPTGRLALSLVPTPIIPPESPPI